MRLTPILLLLAVCRTVPAAGPGYFDMPFGQRLPCSDEKANVWWASSGWKIAADKPAPAEGGEAISISCARNEVEAAQLVLRPKATLKALTLKPGPLTGAGGPISAQNVEVLAVRYVNVTIPTDKSAVAGLWPDPLPPLAGPIDLAAGRNYVFWVRVKAPSDAKAGLYKGGIRLAAEGFQADVPLAVEVFDFTLPDRMTCVTAFGFSPHNVWRYQKIGNAADKRAVLEKYWANFSAHHISPYDPALMESIGVTWPAVRPNPRLWEGGMDVRNETHSGDWALLIYDDDKQQNVTASYKGAVPIGKAGLRLSFWYRTAVPEHSVQVSLNHYDAEDQWMSGCNNDIDIDGDGTWQRFERTITQFPPGARSVRLHLRAALWTDEGDRTGVAWFDEVSLKDIETGREWIEGGEFGPPPLPPFDPDRLHVKLDFSRWDEPMARAIDHYHFNSFRLPIPGMGGGTFHARNDPQLLGFTDDTPHYRAMFNSYCRQVQEHLRQKGWLDEAFVYWFDEPAPRDYAFVTNGFNKLKAAAPDINRMLTEQVEPELIGGPNIWCPVSDAYQHEAAQERRKHGEKFWWYVCTGPKAPYCTLFIDHPGTELRVWLWQTWQRGIDGILVWETNYWTSSAAYPPSGAPQNPYEDPMGWTSGYSTPEGQKRPWGNGDGRFIYPPLAAADANPAGPVPDGPVDSIRWEMLRDGIEDYEYFVILKRLLDAKADKLDAQTRARYEGLLTVPEDVTRDMTTFTVAPAPLERHRVEVARAIARLDRL